MRRQGRRARRVFVPQGGGLSAQPVQGAQARHLEGVPELGQGRVSRGREEGRVQGRAGRGQRGQGGARGQGRQGLRRVQGAPLFVQARGARGVRQGGVPAQRVEGDEVEAQERAALGVGLLVLREAVDVGEADGAQGAAAGGQGAAAAPRGDGQGAGGQAETRRAAWSPRLEPARPHREPSLRSAPRGAKLPRARSPGASSTPQSVLRHPSTPAPS